jgi:hypothetical protein
MCLLHPRMCQRVQIGHQCLSPRKLCTLNIIHLIRLPSSSSTQQKSENVFYTTLCPTMYQCEIRSALDVFVKTDGGRAIAHAVRLGFPQPRPGLGPKSGHEGFVVDNVALGQVLPEYFCFPCQYCTLTYHPGMVQRTH